jgi:hypothetical protein
MADDEGQRMIDISLCPSTLPAGHVFHNGVWRFFWYYQAFSRPLHRYPFLTLLQASQQTVKVVELPSYFSVPNRNTRFYVSNPLDERWRRRHKNPRATLINCLDDFLTSCWIVFAIAGIRGKPTARVTPWPARRGLLSRPVE